MQSVAHHALEAEEYSAVTQRNTVRTVRGMQSVAQNALETEGYSAVCQRNTVQFVRGIQCNHSEEYSAISGAPRTGGGEIQCSHSEGYSEVSQRDTVRSVRGMQSVAHHTLEVEEYSAVSQRNAISGAKRTGDGGIQCSQSEGYSASEEYSVISGAPHTGGGGYSAASQRDTVHLAYSTVQLGYLTFLDFVLRVSHVPTAARVYTTPHSDTVRMQCRCSQDTFRSDTVTQ
eukprot:8239382-Pyramimonas_sp.AAC.1